MSACTNCGAPVPMGVEYCGFCTPRRPHVERTPFTPQAPPSGLTLYFCPACGTLVRDSYDIEPARKRCTKRIHLAEAVGFQFIRVPKWTESNVTASQEAVALGTYLADHPPSGYAERFSDIGWSLIAQAVLDAQGALSCD